MHTSSKSANSDSITIVSENEDFYSAIRKFETLAFRFLEKSEDENLLTSCQVIGYEVIKIVYQENGNNELSVTLQINDNGIQMKFCLDQDAFILLKDQIRGDGYLKNKLAFICDNYVIDESIKSLTCFFDEKSFNRQLSSDRILTLKKYMNKKNINTTKFHDSI